MKQQIVRLLDAARGMIPPPLRFNLLYFFRKDPWNFRTSPYEMKRYERTLAVLGGKSYPRVLEIGCSEGLFTSLLAPRSGCIEAVDCSTVALGRAMKTCARYRHVHFHCLDVRKQLPPPPFHLVSCTEVLYYLGSLSAVEDLRDRLVDLLIPSGHLLLVHMLGEKALSYFSSEGRELHQVFHLHPSLRSVAEAEEEDGYLVTLFERLQPESSPEEGLMG